MRMTHLQVTRGPLPETQREGGREKAGKGRKSTPKPTDMADEEQTPTKKRQRSGPKSRGTLLDMDELTEEEGEGEKRAGEE